MRHSRKLILILMLWVIFLVGCGPQQKLEATDSPLFDGELALDHVEAQVNFGVRPTGSEALAKTGDYIIESLKTAGWEVTEQKFPLLINGKEIQARNITGSIGSGPVIIIGAHYDTRLIANADPDPANKDKPVLGANDGGSGVGVLLELARVLGENYNYNREIRLAFFDAEDNGNVPGWSDWCLGSQYYAEHLDVVPEYVVVVDMIGDKDLNVYYEGNSMQNAPDIVNGIWAVAHELGYGESFPQKIRFHMTDDHIPFMRKGIPAVDLIDFDYPYWHTVSDTLDKVSAESLEKIGRTLQEYLEGTDAIDSEAEATVTVESGT
jgi:glutaminyl-peptide cyclotransferase